MKEENPAPPAVGELQLKIKPERRAAKIANTKIAESTKILASNKIIATSAPLPPPKPRAKPRQAPKNAKVPPKSAAAAASPKFTVVKTPAGNKSSSSLISVKSGGVETEKLVAMTKTVMVTKKTTATSLLNPRFIASPTTKTLMTTAKLTSTIQGKQVTLLTKPLMGGKSVVGLNKVPLLVFNQSSGQVQSFIPLTAGALPPNALIGIATTKRSVPGNVAVAQPKLVSLAPKTLLNAANVTAKTVAQKPKKPEIDLIMECEEDELSAVQRIACKKAESDYIEMLRKIKEWKSNPEVQVITIGADDPLPPLPTIPDVIEASRMPLIHRDDDNDDREITSTPMEVSTNRDSETTESIPVISELQSGISGKVVVQPQQEKEPESILIKSSSATQGASVKPAEEIAAKSVPQPVICEVEPELRLHLVPQKLLPHKFITAKTKELEDMFNGLIASGSQALEKWMLEKGLFGSTRYCLFHSNIQMKLMYMSCLNDDQNKSGYKWWCPSCAVMVSASQGSFFSRWKMSYNDILRVVYHWACNHQAKKVIPEFDNNSEFVCSVYKSLRAICNAQTIHWRIGGCGHSVELADLRIGSCKDFTNVMIYCAYDRVTRLVMLGVTPTCNIKFSLATLLKTYVAQDTTVVGDRIIQPNIPPVCRLTYIGSSMSSNAANLNASAYLRDQVDPVLSEHYKNMSLATIQSVLDELGWREKFAQNPKDAFMNIITHIKQAYVCSVVTTKDANSVPITMASGRLKVVDTSKILTDQPALPPNNPPTVSTKSEEMSTEVPNKTPPPTTEGDDDDYVLPVTADCILEETPGNEEESIVIDAENDTISTSVVGKATVEAPIPPMKPSEVYPNWIRKGKPVCEEIKVNVVDAPSNTSRPPQSHQKESITMPLETYFYARTEEQQRRPPASETASKLSSKFIFKCSACKRLVDDNVKMTKHLNNHIDSIKYRNAEMNNISRCKTCFRDFRSPFAMQTHVEHVHSAASTLPVCKICCKEFPKVSILQNHMKNNHKRFEMPYQCKICRFRSSFFHDIIQHFYKTHNNLDKLLCRHCLQVFTVKFASGPQKGISYDFFKHLHRHLSKRRNKRCNLCCLTFLTVTELTQHKVNDHVSFKNHNGVIPVKAIGESPVMVSISNLGGTTSNVKKGGDKVVSKPIQKSVRLSEPEVDPIAFMCIECKTSLYRTNHFIQNMGCSMCKFVTSCSRSFADHAIKFHSVPPRKKPRPFRSLSDHLHCLCNYTTLFGDQMARHLVSSKCSYTWCYMESSEHEMNSAKSRHIIDSHNQSTNSVISTIETGKTSLK